jgi:hypothetical protein
VELTIPSRLVPARTGICSQEWNTTAKDISNSANLITKYADASFPYDRDSYDDKSFEASCSKKCASIG